MREITGHNKHAKLNTAVRVTNLKHLESYGIFIEYPSQQ